VGVSAADLRGPFQVLVILGQTPTAPQAIAQLSNLSLSYQQARASDLHEASTDKFILLHNLHSSFDPVAVWPQEQQVAGPVPAAGLLSSNSCFSVRRESD